MGRGQLCNAQGQLSELRDGNNVAIARYVYRGDGKRAWKELANGTRSYFFYMGEQLTATSNGAEASTLWLWGADGVVGRRGFNTATGAVSKFYSLYDTQGNLAQSLDASNGSVVNQSATSAWGEPLRDESGNASGGYGAKWGYLYDSESGFYLCTLRYYDPSAGRWLTRDPIGYAGGSNLYGYVGNDPVNMTDPSGLDPILPQALIGVGDTYINGNPLQNFLGVTKEDNGPNGSIAKSVEAEINAAAKYLKNIGYDVIIDKHLSYQDLDGYAKNDRLKALFFIGHSDLINHNLILLMMIQIVRSPRDTCRLKILSISYAVKNSIG